MGAIAGLFHPATPKPVDPARLRAMVAAMAHRGPDGAGEWTAPGVGFAHRRLATVGGAQAAQPVATPDLRYAAMLDGTILNHAALREELRAAGHGFVGAGDAEVVLHGFAAWGPALLDRLEGGFAIAVHDAATQTLFLARDRLGAKPLHHAVLPDGALAFASELKGLLAHPLLRRVPDAAAVADFVALGHVPDDTCVIAGVEKLPAAHFLLIERGRTRRPPRRWWTVPEGGASARDALLPELRGAVARTATGAVPGVLLLGGMADAAIVALLAEASAKAVRTVAVGDDAAVAARFATAHRVADLRDVAAWLPALAAAFDEPFAAPGAIAALAAADAARGGGAVVLAGTGAELVLDGATRWRGFARRERLRRADWMPRRVAGLLGDRATDHGAATGMLPAAVRDGVWSAAGRQAVAAHRPDARFAAYQAGRDPLAGAVAADLALRLPAAALTLADRAGMAAGVEWRTPFADHRLVAFAEGLPVGRPSTLAAAMARHLPAMPVAAPPPPVAAWLRGPLDAAAAGVARSTLLAELGWFDLDHLAQYAAAHRAGHADHGTLLWRMLVLERSLSRLFGWPASA
jgi:asparagine synthase (glutamine-hydrolysing)